MGLNRPQPGVQAHCLRREMATDLRGTLTRLAGMGFRDIELCSFPGCAGNPWGDFGALADVSPERVGEALLDAGLRCIATHVMLSELTPGSFDDTIRWVQGVGAPVVVLAGLGNMSDAGRDDWCHAFDSLNALGQQVAAQGLGFAYHTQNDVWRPVAGTLPALDLLEITDPALCAIELDPSGSLVTGADWQGLVGQYPGRFFAMHLRDGIRPGRDVPYLPAVPLGEGDEDWPGALQAAAGAGISRYLLEMEVAAGEDVFAALQDSLAHLERIGWLAGPDTRSAA